MTQLFRELNRAAILAGGVLCFFAAPSAVNGAEPAAPKAATELPSVSLFDALKKGDIAVEAKGNGDGGMTVVVKNKTRRKLRVVLPPGLVASGASGQMGGMGGMGGGGGGGMGGGGMGGGGMGGGGGGGMGGGGMGGGGQGQGMSRTLPASAGMMMLATLITRLVAPGTWDLSGMMMMGGMGGGGGGGMGGGGMGGGGMGGGMGGGGMGGGGGGFRSVPPTMLPSADLNPGQTREMATRLVTISSADPSNPLATPAKDEPLKISDIGQVSNDPKVAKALRRLAADKAPNSLAQLVMWNVSGGLSWENIATLSADWSNPHELVMAKRFVQNLDLLGNGETGELRYEITATPELKAIADELAATLKGQLVLGLKAEAGVAEAPTGPAIGCKIALAGTTDKPQAEVHVLTSDGEGQAWTAVGKFNLPVRRSEEKVKSVEFADSFAEGVLGRLVRAQLSKGPRVKGKETYYVRIDNASPLLLNGLAITGEGIKGENVTPNILSGIAIPPRNNLTVSATGSVVEKLGLKKGVKVVAADLSGL